MTADRKYKKESSPKRKKLQAQLEKLQYATTLPLTGNNNSSISSNSISSNSTTQLHPPEKNKSKKKKKKLEKLESDRSDNQKRSGSASHSVSANVSRGTMRFDLSSSGNGQAPGTNVTVSFTVGGVGGVVGETTTEETPQ